MRAGTSELLGGALLYYEKGCSPDEKDLLQAMHVEAGRIVRIEIYPMELIQALYISALSYRTSMQSFAF